MGKHDATVISVTPEGATAEPTPAPAPATATPGGYAEAPAEAPAVRKASKSSNRSDDSSKFHVDMSCLGGISKSLWYLNTFDAIQRKWEIPESKFQVPVYFRVFYFLFEVSGFST